MTQPSGTRKQLSLEGLAANFAGSLGFHRFLRQVVEDARKLEGTGLAQVAFRALVERSQQLARRRNP
jgi:hypothetical protein